MSKVKANHITVNEESHSERGASMIEASVVMLVFFPVILLSVYFFFLTVQLTSAHYEIQDSLRQVSTGPRPGETQAQLTQRFMDTVTQKLKSHGLTPRPGTINAAGGGVSIGFPTNVNVTHQGVFAPNNFVVVKFVVDIFPDDLFGKKMFGILIPRPRVITGMKMANY